MSDEKKPPIEFDANVPTKVKLSFDKPKTGSGISKSGKPFNWSMWGVEYGGEQRIFFGDPELDNLLSGFPRGAEVVITRKEVHKDGRKYNTWTANQVIFDAEGAKTKEKAEVVQGKIDSRAERMANCLKDAYTALLAVPELMDIRKNTDDPAFSMEDVRTIGVSLYIEESKIR